MTSTWQQVMAPKQPNAPQRGGRCMFDISVWTAFTDNLFFHSRSSLHQLYRELSQRSISLGKMHFSKDPWVKYMGDVYEKK